MLNKKRVVIGCLAILVAIVALLPCYASGYIVAFAAIVMMFVVLSQAWNIFSGFTGYVSFGHHVYFGVGCYVSAILLSRYGISVYLSMLVAAAAAAMLALIISGPTLRLKGAYFSLSTLAVAIAVHVLSLNIPSLTRGGKGITLPPEYHLLGFFYVMLIFALMSIGLAILVKNSKIGLAVSAIRGDEDLAASIGVSSFKYKAFTLILSAILWGSVGNFYAWYVTYMHPSDAFHILRLVTAMVGVLMGGVGSIGGTVIGAIAFGFLNEVLWARFSTIYLILLGIVVVLIVRFAPDGLLKGGQRVIQKIRTGRG